eukprot:scaffold101419_cov72-Phaeocystis_antarctica.AAC.2
MWPRAAVGRPIDALLLHRQVGDPPSTRPVVAPRRRALKLAKAVCPCAPPSQPLQPRIDGFFTPEAWHSFCAGTPAQAYLMGHMRQSSTVRSVPRASPRQPLPVDGSFSAHASRQPSLCTQIPARRASSGVHSRALQGTHCPAEGWSSSVQRALPGASTLDPACCTRLRGGFQQQCSQGYLAQCRAARARVARFPRRSETPLPVWRSLGGAAQQAVWTASGRIGLWATARTQ